MDWSKFTTRAFLLTICEGQVEEYKRRHDEIWPEMVEALKARGIVHYEIYLHEPTRRVFGHMLCTRPTVPEDFDDPVVKRWSASMVGILETDQGRSLAEPIERVFYLTA